MAMENDDKVQKRYRIAGFDMDLDTLNMHILKYKQMAADGEVELPSWPDWVSRAGLTEAVCAEVMDRAAEGPSSAYYERGRALGDLWQWCRGQYISNPNWGATAARVNKAMMLYKMLPNGEERARPATVQTKQGPSEIVISFGSGDKRAREAGG
jgi:hypothetical protein